SYDKQEHVRGFSVPESGLGRDDNHLAGIIRGDEIILLTGDTVLESEGRGIVFARQHAIAKAGKLLFVKPEFI
ncbi:MAG: hypothetical protein ACLFS7_06415, partial [Desulfosudaceae bacterium]